MKEIDALYDLLREADKRAEGGDAQAKADAQKIYDAIQNAEREVQKSKEIPPAVTGTVGGYLGGVETAGIGAYKLLKGAKGMYDADQMRKQAQMADMVSKAVKQAAPPSTPAAPGGSAWNQQLTGLSVPGSQMSKPWLDVNRSIQNVVSPLSDLPEFRGGSVSPAGVIMPPQIGAQPTQQPAPSSAFSSAVDRAKQMGGALPRIGGTAMRAAGPIAGGFGAGFEGAEAMNRFERGDPLGGAISTVGAGAGLASMYPPLAPIGLPISYGAMGLNYLIDKYRGGPKYKSVMEKAEGGLVGGLASIPQPSALTAQMAQQSAPQHGLPPVHSLDMLSTPSSSGSRPFNDMYNPNMRYMPSFKEGGSTTPAWQRKEGKNPEGGLNAAGRASYNRETGGNLQPPVSAKAAKSSPKKAARRKSFCARMSGNPGPMKDEKGRPTRKALALKKWDC